ncbi:MAG: hypothetical protein ACREQ5_00820 [Candidatus Dormibacteria bacterium]
MSTAREVHDLRFLDTVEEWTEWGDYTSLSESYVTACDGSGPELQRGGNSVGGAAVDPFGRWWCWRVVVRDDVAGMASAWAEYVTLLLAMRMVPAAAVVYCDNFPAINYARAVTSQIPVKVKPPVMVKRLGGFPAFPRPSTYPDVQYASGMGLHTIADALSRRAKRGPDLSAQCGGTAWSFPKHCAAIAAGWSQHSPKWREWIEERWYDAERQRWFPKEEAGEGDGGNPG